MGNLYAYCMAALLILSIIGVAQAQKDTEQSEKGVEESVEIVYGYSFEDNKKGNTSLTINSTILSLQSFEGKVMADHVLLKWRSNLGESLFTIEHATSDKAEDFKSIGETDLTYNFENDLYSFKVISYQPGCNYFRFKVKKGNQIMVSKSYMVMAGESGKHILDIQTQDLDKKIMLQVKKQEKISLKLVDKKGVTIKKLVNEQAMMENEILFKVLKYDEFKGKTLFLVLEGDTIRESRRLIF